MREWTRQKRRRRGTGQSWWHFTGKWCWSRSIPVIRWSIHCRDCS